MTFQLVQTDLFMKLVHNMCSLWCEIQLKVYEVEENLCKTGERVDPLLLRSSAFWRISFRERTSASARFTLQGQISRNLAHLFTDAIIDCVNVQDLKLSPYFWHLSYQISPRIAYPRGVKLKCHQRCRSPLNIVIWYPESWEKSEKSIVFSCLFS